MTRKLAELDLELEDCYSLIPFEAIERKWLDGIERTNWPKQVYGDEEITHRQQVINKLAHRRQVIESSLQVQPEPNLLMAGE